jgi:two-component system, LytTR family, response regulator
MDNKKITSLIVDDEPDARIILTELLKGFSEFEVISAAGSVDSAMKVVIRDNPEVIFLDVEMSPKNGFDMVDELRQLKVNPTIIFTTGYEKYAIEAIRCAAFDYLLKPIEKSALEKTINRFKNNRSNAEEFSQKSKVILDFLRKPKIKFNTRSSFLLVDPDEVLFCEADANYTMINLINQKQLTVSYNLGEVDRLFANNDFSRCGRSHLINKRYVAQVNKKLKTITFSFNNIEMNIEVTKRCIKDLERFLA